MTVAELIALHDMQWRSATSGPFLDAVRDSSLPEAAFERWLTQDHLFVGDLFRFQAELLTRAPRPAQRALTAGLVALEAELGWFEQQLSGRALAPAADREPVTAAYHRLFAECVEHWPAGITALWTGERTYNEAWGRAAPGAPAYREFVERWTHPDFAVYVADLGALVDAAGPDEAVFLKVCELERQFWSMAWDSATS